MIFFFNVLRSCSCIRSSVLIFFWGGAGFCSLNDPLLELRFAGLGGCTPPRDTWYRGDIVEM